MKVRKRTRYIISELVFNIYIYIYEVIKKRRNWKWKGKEQRGERWIFWSKKKKRKYNMVFRQLR